MYAANLFESNRRDAGYQKRFHESFQDAFETARQHVIDNGTCAQVQLGNRTMAYMDMDLSGHLYVETLDTCYSELWDYEELFAD